MLTSRRLLGTLLLIFGLTISACSGGGDSGSATEQLQSAAKTLTDAEAIELDLSATSLPAGQRGLLSAIGVGNHSPAFQGEVKAVAGGVTIGAEVIAVDGKVWAKTGFSPTFLPLDPKQLGAPDPAKLIGTADEPGFTAWFGLTESPKSDGKSRDGENVYTKITGKIPGEQIKRLLPSADAKTEFAVVYRLNEDGQLHDMKVTGPFYGADVDDVAYTLKAKPAAEAVTVEAP